MSAIEKEPGDETASYLEAAHRVLAFTSMHCHMRGVAAAMYNNITMFSKEHAPLDEFVVPGFESHPPTEKIQKMLDELLKAIMPVQEIFSLLTTVGWLAERGYPPEQLASWEASCAEWYEKKQGLYGFADLYDRFKWTSVRLGRPFVFLLAAYALSPPPRIPGNIQDISELARTVADVAAEDPLYSPVLRLTRVMSVVEHCPYVDFRTWELEEKDKYLRDQLSTRYGVVQKRSLLARQCFPGQDDCYLYRMYLRLDQDKDGFRRDFLEFWLGLCGEWHSSTRAGLRGVVDPPPDETILPACTPTYYSLGNKIMGTRERPARDPRFLFVEYIRQQLVSGRGLECPLFTSCDRNRESCPFAGPLRQLWLRSRPGLTCLFWSKPSCL
jgi:hypothetical protein